jgi:excisionase family DNA binding protein
MNISLESDYITVAEIKKYLKISQSAAYGLVNSEGFPVCRIGGSIRIPKTAFLAWVQHRTHIPAYLNDYLSKARPMREVV